MLTRDEAIDRLNEVFVVLATTNIRGLPTQVELGIEDGMPRACVLNAGHVASLPKGYLSDLIAKELRGVSQKGTLLDWHWDPSPAGWRRPTRGEDGTHVIDGRET